MAATRPSETSRLSPWRRGESRRPVTSSPMLTSPSVPIALLGHGCRPVPLSVLAEAALGQLAGAVPVVGPVEAGVHHRLARRVEHLVLQLSTGELGADHVPDQLQELDPLAGVA